MVLDHPTKGFYEWPLLLAISRVDTGLNHLRPRNSLKIGLPLNFTRVFGRYSKKKTHYSKLCVYNVNNLIEIFKKKNMLRKY